MSHVGRKHGRGADAVIADCQAELGPVRTTRRQTEIEALPTVLWKGRMLYTLRCCGTSGKGPHDVHVPLAMVWSLIRLDPFYCVYHVGDAWG